MLGLEGGRHLLIAYMVTLKTFNHPVLSFCLLLLVLVLPLSPFRLFRWLKKWPRINRRRTKEMMTVPWFPSCHWRRLAVQRSG